MVEIKVDTEGINPYELINKETEENVGFMEYDDEIRYCIPKEQLGNFVLDCRKNELLDKIISYRVRSVGEEITENIKLEDIIIYLRIDPEFGIFWWYMKNLPRTADWSEFKMRAVTLLGMYFLANY